jgi:predicted ATP-grasp superfamily ATP-dependent carboligase
LVNKSSNSKFHEIKGKIDSRKKLIEKMKEVNNQIEDCMEEIEHTVRDNKEKSKIWN